MKYIIRSLFFLVIVSYANVVLAQDTTKVPVEFTTGENTLYGTLVLPAKAVNVPVLIFLGGIDEYGDPHRNRDTFIEENLISLFPGSGIAVFYYYPRGVESSTGKWHRATLSEFAADAEAAIQYLRQRKEIDESRIGIIGHGEGGWVAQIVAANNPQKVKMMASLAGPTFDALTQLTNEYHNEYVCEGEDSTEAYSRASEKAISHENWVSLFPFTKRWRHMKLKQEYEPAKKLQGITVPALFVFGEFDGKVYPSWAKEHLNQIFPDSLPPNFAVQTIPGTNHYFKVTGKCYEFEEGSIEKNYSFRFKEVLRNWVFEQL